MTKAEAIQKIFEIWTVEGGAVWLLMRNKFLDDKRPADMLDDESGLALIANMLGRLEAGVYF